MRAFVILSFVLAIFLANQPVALAQFSELSGGSETVIDLRPSFPQPGDEVKATLNSGGNNDLFGANITWLLDGKEVLSAQNSRSFEFTATEAGVAQIITAILNKPNKALKEIERIFTPLYQILFLNPKHMCLRFILVGQPLV